jgi:hypothetical protein
MPEAAFLCVVIVGGSAAVDFLQRSTWLLQSVCRSWIMNQARAGEMESGWFVGCELLSSIREGEYHDRLS